jgi:hypothetical protein
MIYKEVNIRCIQTRVHTVAFPLGKCLQAAQKIDEVVDVCRLPMSESGVYTYAGELLVRIAFCCCRDQKETAALEERQAAAA